MVTVTPAPGYFKSSDGDMAAPNVREKAQASKDQGAVWDEVANAERANNTTSETGTLNRVFKDETVRARIDACERALRTALPERAVGIIAAINGEFVSADVFGSPSLFQAYWPKLLRSLGLQATSNQSARSDDTTLDGALAFLLRASAQKGKEERRRLYTLVERSSDKDATFELRTTRGARTLIHLNKVARQ
jgi:hypothetical protein